MENKFLDLDPKVLPEQGTAADWSQISGENRDTIWRACLAGRLPHTIVGQYRLVKKDDFLAWLQAGFPKRGRPRKNETPGRPEVSR
jgi:hypothetical protein